MDEEISSLAVKLALDDSNFSKGMQNLKRNLGIIDSGFKSSIAGVKDWGKNLDSLKNNAQALGEKIETQRKIVQSYSSQLEKSKTTLEKSSKSMMDLKAKVDDARKAYEESKATLGANAEETKKLGTGLNDLTEKYEKNERTVVNNNKSVQGYTIQLNNAQGKLKDFEGQLDDTNKKIANFKLTSLSASLEETSAKFKSIGEGFTKVGDAALKFSAPVVAGLGVATKAATTFEHQIADIRKEVEASGLPISKVNSLMAEMSSDSLKWSGDFGQSTDDINTGLLTLVKDGYSADEAIKIMNTDLYTSRGANEDLAVVVDQLGSSLEAYGMKTNNAAQTTQNMSKMADAFAYISNHTKASISSLGEAFSTAGSTANAMKIPMTQTAAAIGILESNGVDASTAANALKAGLVNLTKPTDQMAAAMDKMNLKVFDAKGNMKDLPTLLNDIEKGTKGWTNENKQAALATIFGKESLSSWNVLVHKGGDYLNELSTGANNATGEVKKLSDSMKDTAANNFKELSASVHSLGVEFGQNVLPSIIPVVKETTNLVKSFGNLSPTAQKAIIDITGFTLATGILAKGIGGAYKAGSGFLEFLGKITGKAAEAGAASKVAGTAVKGAGLAAAEAGTATAGAATASGGFAASLGAAALAAGPYVLAAGAIAAGGVAVYKVMADKTIPSVDLFADKVQEDTNKASDSFDSMNNKVKASSSNTESSVVKISDATKKAVQSYIQMDDNVKKTMTDIYVNADKFTDQTKKSVISQYTEMANSAKNLNTGMKTDSINQFKQLVSQTGNLSKENVETIVAKYTDMVSKVSGLTKQQKETMVKNFRDGLTESIGITQQQVNSIVQQITAMGTKIKEAMDKQSTDRYTTLKNFFDKSSALSSQSEQKILQNMQTYNNNRKQKITSYEAQITAIYQRASNNHRDLTVQEQQQVNSLQDKMRTNAVQSLSSSEIQSKVILERMKSYGTSITEQQAQSIIQSANKQRDGAIAAANSQYNKVVADAIYQRDVTHTMTADQANKVIKNAGTQRDGAIQAAKDQRTSVVDHLSKMDGEVLSNMNTDTGEMLSPWDKLIGDIKKKWTDFKEWLSSIFGKFGIKIGASYSYSKAVEAKGGYAKGTLDAAQGWHWVGENGPELLYFAGGESVIDNKSSKNIAQQVNMGYDDSSKNISDQLKASEKYGQDLNTSLGKGLTDSADKVTTPVNTLNANNAKVMDTAVQSFLTHGQNIDKNLGTAITNNEGTVTTATNGLVTANKNILQSFVSSCIPIGQGVGNSIAQGIQNSEKNATDMAKELAQKIIAAFEGPEGFDVHSPSRKTTWMGEMLGAGAIKGWSSSQVLTFFKNEIGDITSFMQGSSKQLAEWLSVALAITGQPMSALPALEQIAIHESGGNPLAVNNWDINAQRGDPSKGLMQIIGSNFSKYHLPGLDNIYNPIANAAASIEYMLDRYGSIWNVPGVKSIMSGGGYRPYASGTNSALPGWQLKGENGPELEYSPNGGETIIKNRDTTNLLNIPNMLQNLGKQLSTVGNNIVNAIQSLNASRINLNVSANVSVPSSNANITADPPIYIIVKDNTFLSKKGIDEFTETLSNKIMLNIKRRG